MTKPADRTRVHWRTVVPYLFVVAGFVLVYHVRSDDLQHQVTQARIQAVTTCDVSIRDWNAWQKVINTARNPPSTRGRSVTAEQRAALDAYAKELADDVGAKPTCQGSPEP